MKCNAASYTTVTCLGVLLAVSSSAFAHHSFAMFDNTKQITIEGTVKDFQWTNPHTWIQLMVKDPSTGQLNEWGIEGSPTTSLKRRGWTKDSLKPGDKAVVTINPLRSGAAGGGLVSVTVDGKPIGGEPPS